MAPGGPSHGGLRDLEKCNDTQTNIFGAETKRVTDSWSRSNRRRDVVDQKLKASDAQGLSR